MKLATATVAVIVAISGVVYAAEKQATAIVVMTKGYDKGAGLGTGTSQFYDYAPDNRCSGRTRLYKFSPITGAQAEKRVPAGVPIVISGYAKRYQSMVGTPVGPGVSVSESTCENRMSFTPRVGETYVLAHKVRVGVSCGMDITAKRTGRPPEDLQVVDPATCTKG